jgi:hypothetical protein
MDLLNNFINTAYTKLTQEEKEKTEIIFKDVLLSYSKDSGLAEGPRLNMMAYDQN